MITVQASEVRVGDIITFFGTPHLITEIEPYRHPTLGETHGMARAADGWSISLIDGGRVDVERGS